MAEATLNYQTIRTTHAAREADDQRVENRKKNLIILILQWLAEEGYVESARQLEHETNLDVSKYDVCDNVDLDTIIQEYESYFYIKFNRYPKLTKKNAPNAPFNSKIYAKISSAQPSSRRSNVPSLPRVSNNGSTETSNGSPNSSTTNRPPSAGDALRRISYTRKLNRSNSEKLNGHGASGNGGHHSTSQPPGNHSNHPTTNTLEEMSLSFMKVSSVKSTVTGTEHHSPQQQQQQNGTKKKGPGTIIDCRAILNDTLRVPIEDNVDPTDRLLKPLGGYTGYNSEWRELAEVVSRVKKFSFQFGVFYSILLFKKFSFPSHRLSN